MTNKIDDKTLGRILRLAHRDDPRLSLREIGEIVGIDHQTVNYWINPFRNQLVKRNKAKYYKKKHRKPFLKRFFNFLKVD